MKALKYLTYVGKLAGFITALTSFRSWTRASE